MADFTTLKSDCLKLLIDQGFKLRIYGQLPELTKALSKFTGKTIHRNSLPNALTGYRTGQSSYELLRSLKSMLIRGNTNA